MSRIIRQLEKNARQAARDAANSIPKDVAERIQARACEAVNSGEPHKCTGGWIVLPFGGKGHDIRGLLEIAIKALREEQNKAFYAA